MILSNCMGFVTISNSLNLKMPLCFAAISSFFIIVDYFKKFAYFCESLRKLKSETFSPSKLKH